MVPLPVQFDFYRSPDPVALHPEDLADELLEGVHKFSLGSSVIEGVITLDNGVARKQSHVFSRTVPSYVLLAAIAKFERICIEGKPAGKECRETRWKPVT